MELNSILEELKEELISQKGFLWSKKNKDSITKCLSLVDDVQMNLPSALQEATYIITQKQKILAAAQDAANKIVAEATQKAQELTAENAITKQAQIEAEAMVGNANKRCNQLYSSTRDNIDKMLKAIEDYLTDNLHVVRNNREELAGGAIIRKPNKDKQT